MTDTLGRVRAALAERYTVVRELGRGGAGVVYLALDRKHRREIALKALRPEIASALGGDRFLREVEIAAKLAHPNILPLYDSGEVDGLLYFTMPYMPGETLRHLITRQGPLPPSDVVRLGAEILDALGHAHGRNVVHRDIKPENILLADGHAVVADFGIAKAISLATDDWVSATGLAIGTPAYMSPEQIAGARSVDGRSDLYSLGCVLYEMCVGRPPFAAPTPQALMAQHLHAAPPPLDRLRPELPAGLEEAITTALAKVPEERFPDAGAFSRALQAQGRPGVSGRARYRVAGLLVTIALLVGVGASLVRTGTTPPVALDPDRIVVFPLALREGAARPALGEDLATGLQIALNSTASKRAVDGWQLVGQKQRSDPRELTPEDAERVTREQRARYFVRGSVLEGDSVLLSLELHDLMGDSALHYTITARGDEAAWPLGFRAAKTLLPTLVAPGEPIELREISSSNPAALASFVSGEQAFRRARFQQAFEAYGDALRADSGLGLAALRAAEAAHWLHDVSQAGALVEVALQRPEGLPSRHRAIAEGWRAYFAGDGDGAAALFSGVLAGDSAWSDAWIALGETFNHLLPKSAPLDSLAESAFERAHRLAPAFAPTLYHLIEFAVRRGDLARAGQLLERFRSSEPEAGDLAAAELMVGCLQGSVGPDRWRRATLSDAAAVLQAASALTRGGLRRRECSHAAWNALMTADTSASEAGRNRRFATLVGLQSQLAGMGRARELRELLAADTTFDPLYHDHLLILDADAGAPVEAEADSAATRLRAIYRAKGPEAGTLVRWLIGVRDVGHGRLSDAERLARSLDSSAADGSRLARVFSRSLTARLALARGDTAAAVATLDSLVPSAPVDAIEWTPWESLGAERVTLAEVLLARGSPEAALRIALNFDAPAPIAYVLYLRRALAVVARAAAQTGDRRLELRSRRRLQELDAGVAGAGIP